MNLLRTYRRIYSLERGKKDEIESDGKVQMYKGFAGM